MHLLAKTYGLPPHLLARCTLAELAFDQEVYRAGLAFEREGKRRAARGGRGRLG